MEKRKLLSVIVPTKDRYKYLKFLIELVADFHSDEIELVIQDNSDNNLEFVDYLNSLKYDFIRYNHIQGQIPMSVNSDKAIQNSTGEFLCFLGDDDGLTKYSIDCAKWMKKNDIEAVKPAEVLYFWPDYNFNTASSHPASIRYKNFTSAVIFKDPYKELLTVLKKGIVNKGDMPLVYHAFVSRNALDRVYKKCGTYFPGNSPDISNAVALSLTVKRYVVVNFPLAFSGCSVNHGGGVYAKGRRGEPKISEVPWFRPNAEENWDKRLPRIASPSLIWADSALNALKLMNREDLYSKVNFTKLYANFAVLNSTYCNLLWPLVPKNSIFKCFVLINYLKRYLFGGMRRLKVKLRITSIKNNVKSVIEASSILESEVSKNPF